MVNFGYFDYIGSATCNYSRVSFNCNVSQCYFCVLYFYYYGFYRDNFMFTPIACFVSNMLAMLSLRMCIDFVKSKNYFVILLRSRLLQVNFVKIKVITTPVSHTFVIF